MQEEGGASFEASGRHFLLLLHGWPGFARTSDLFLMIGSTPKAGRPTSDNEASRLANRFSRTSRAGVDPH
jgi:hypothetical protein